MDFNSQPLGTRVDFMEAFVRGWEPPVPCGGAMSDDERRAVASHIRDALLRRVGGLRALLAVASYDAAAAPLAADQPDVSRCLDEMLRACAVDARVAPPPVDL